ncbi:MAG: hypothetical protein QOC58_419 [Mycobacterium sp.]|nr:hypothetical protein [Mycobacterium sp.]
MLSDDRLHLAELHIGRVHQRTQSLDCLQPQGCSASDIEGRSRRGGYRHAVNVYDLTLQQRVRMNSDSERRPPVVVN